MNYFYVSEIETQETHLCESTIALKKGDYVVVANYGDEPVTAVVEKIVSRYKALTSNECVEVIIDVVNVKAWQAQREKALENRVLLDKMQSKISEIKMVEQLEKYAGRDPEMLELLNEYKGNPIIENETEFE